MTSSQSTRRFTAIALTLGSTLAAVALSAPAAQAKKGDPTVTDGLATLSSARVSGPPEPKSYP